MHDEAIPAPVAPLIGHLTLHEILTSLKRGIGDFSKAPAYGFFFSAFYVIAGWMLIAFGAGSLTWTLAMVLGFPLVAPFAAVGLYEVSRRLEAGEVLVFSEILGVVLAERRRQLPWIGLIVVITFLFWSFFAHMLFALVLGLSAMKNISTSYDVFLTSEGMTLIAAEIVVGGMVALLTFAGTVVSLPFALEREVDFVTAILTSFRAFSQNFVVMLVWATVIAGLVFLAILPGLLGLFVVLPILGHASWHIYRRVLYDPV